MIFRTTDIFRFQKLMKDKKIICFGAGNALEHFFSICQLVDNITYIIDNDSSKWGSCRKIHLRRREIVSPKVIKTIADANSVILITTGKYDSGMEIFRQLEQMQDINIDVFWNLFIMNEPESRRLSYDHQMPSTLKLSAKPIIPKIIHYAWFGDKEIPPKHQKYIEGWKRLCPDYEIICWNEKNYDISKNAYMEQAYKAKAWGFVPDYLRKDVVYQYGGIYLDTDVELIKPIDNLLYQEGFCGTEGTRVAFGLGFGARKGLPILKEMMEAYERISFHYEERERMKIGPEYETELLQTHGLQLSGTYQNIAGLTVYPPEVLSGTVWYNDKGLVTENTYAVHHYAGSWIDSKYRAYQNDLRRIYGMCKLV